MTQNAIWVFLISFRALLACVVHAQCSCCSAAYWPDALVIPSYSIPSPFPRHILINLCTLFVRLHVALIFAQSFPTFPFVICMQSKCALAVAPTSAPVPLAVTSPAASPATSPSPAPSPVATLFSCVLRLCFGYGYGCRNRASIVPEWAFANKLKAASCLKPAPCGMLQMLHCCCSASCAISMPCINYPVAVKLKASIACQFLNAQPMLHPLILPLPLSVPPFFPSLSATLELLWGLQKLATDKWQRNFFDNCC